MLNFSMRRVVSLIVLLVLFFCILLGVMRSFWLRGESAIAEATERKDELTRELHECKDTLRYCKSDEYIMRVARDELDMIFPGEFRYKSK